ncbi:MAG: ester cyclase [Chloroflexi bacterium]|nr:ester cyclase [Chloroflexota bacterium]
MENQKEIALSVSKSILNGEWDKLAGILSDDFTYTGDGMHFNKPQYIDFMKGMKAGFSDMQMEFTHVVNEGDLVNIRFITTCKHTGNFMGAPATNKNLEVGGIFIRRVQGNLVVQEWQTTDLLGTLSQMGFGTLFAYAIFNVLFKPKKK